MACKYEVYASFYMGGWETYLDGHAHIDGCYGWLKGVTLFETDDRDEALRYYESITSPRDCYEEECRYYDSLIGMYWAAKYGVDGVWADINAVSNCESDELDELDEVSFEPLFVRDYKRVDAKE